MNNSRQNSQQDWKRLKQLVKETARVTNNNQRYVCVGIKNNQLAETKLMQNFGYLLAAHYADGKKSLFYCVTDPKWTDADAIHFYAAILLGYEWSHGITFSVKKGLPL